MARDCSTASDQQLDWSPIHVLLIEDNKAECRFIQEVLRDAVVPMPLVHVPHLQQAINLLATSTFDVILLDLTLPDSNGFESLDRLLPHAGRLPIVILTNVHDENLAVAAVRQGAQDYLFKRHIDEDSLVRSLRYAIERKQSAEALREANELLEKRVVERTAELANANQLLQSEIHQRQQMEAQFLHAQRLESLGTLASGIAHDFNNILTPILAIAQLLPYKLAPSNPQVERMLKTLEDSARRGANLVQQILSFARGMEGKHVTISIEPVLIEIEKMLMETLPKAIDIQGEIAADLWLIEGDATQLHQVFMNLCVNARDAMETQGLLRISASNQHLDEAATQQFLGSAPGDYVVVTVQDTGSGMDAEVMKRIFDPFFTTKEVGKGTGLGLSAVLGIVKSHGGFVTVDSVVSQGSQFRVYLPAVTTPLPIVPLMKPLISGQAELILVIDDESTICDMAQMMLEEHGYHVLVASDGLMAQKIVSDQPEIICALVDLMMPLQDALTTFEKLHAAAPALPLIAMSGLRNAGLIKRLQAVGCRSFLAKPFTVIELLTALQESIVDRVSQPVQ